MICGQEMDVKLDYYPLDFIEGQQIAFQGEY
jgi:hypothetical protein